MSCVLSILGDDFDIDAFLLKSQLAVDIKKYKGEPFFKKTQPDGRKMTFSRIGVTVSDASFNDFDGQVADVMKYFRANQDKLSHILNDSSIEKAYIDFGLNYNYNLMCNSITFPRELLEIVSKVGVTIAVSYYEGIDDEE